MTTLVLSDYLADQSLAPALYETVFDKPTIDEAGNWTRRLFAYSRDGKGRHDRPLLTAADLSPDTTAIEGNRK